MNLSGMLDLMCDQLYCLHYNTIHDGMVWLPCYRRLINSVVSVNGLTIKNLHGVHLHIGKVL